MDHHPTGALPRPRTGAYYWIPIPPLRSPTWRVLGCHDLGFDEDLSHFDLWPAVIPHLATMWGRDPEAMKRRLGRHCYGLPRGRVTRPDKVFLILHGDDSPLQSWTEAVVQAFRLQGRRTKALLDVHEQRLPGDIRALARILGRFPVLADLRPSHQTPDDREDRHPGLLGEGIGLHEVSDPPTCRTPPRGREEA